MALTLITAPTQEPLTLDEVKAHLRVDTSDEHAGIWAAYVAGREHVEAMTGRRLLTQTWDLVLDSFANDGEYIRGGEIWLPFPPVQSVTSITYVDNAGTSQTWSSSSYSTELPSGPHAGRGRIFLAYNETFPTTRNIAKAVTVRFVCGYTASTVPLMLKACLLEMARAGYERNAKTAQEIVDWVDRQLQPFVVAQAW